MLLTLVLTHQCDLACTYCYAGPKNARSMPVEVGRRAIDRALEGLSAGEDLGLGLFGGEPLLEWPLGRELVRYARSRARRRRVTAQLTTNGTHLTPAIADEALALGVSLAVSMDGLPEVHDSFRPRRGGQPSSGDALRAIDLLVRRAASFAVNMVVRPETVDRLGEGARVLVAHGVRRVLPSLDYGADWRPEHAPLLRRAIADLRRLYVDSFSRVEIGWLETKVLLLAKPDLARPSCGRGRGEVAVAPSGRLYPCERLVADDAEDLGFGHVDHPEGPTPLECEGVPAVTGSCGSPTAGTPCANCAARPYCASDCMCANLARTGAANAPDGLICLLEQTCLAEARLALEELARRPARRSRRRRRLPLAGAVRG